MRFQIRKVIGYEVFAEVEANSLEEAKEMFETRRDLEWDETDPDVESVDYSIFIEDEEDEDEGGYWEPIDEE